MGYRRRGTKWQVDNKLAGKRVRFTVDTEEEAMIEDARSRAALMTGKEYHYRNPNIKTSKQDLREVAYAHFNLEWKDTKNEAGNLKNMNQLFDFFGPRLPISELTSGRVIEFIEYCRDVQHNADSTINRKLSCLRQIMKYAEKKGYIDRMPEIPWRKEGNTRMRFITPEEEPVILSYHKTIGLPVYSDFWMFLLDTGFRVSEAIRFDMRRDYHDGKLYLWDKETKNGEGRTVPASPRVQEMLMEYSGQPFSELTPAKVNHQWNAMKMVMGLENDKEFVPHCLRHTCATRLAAAGVPVHAIQAWMGHKTIQVTMRYIKLVAGQLEDALKSLTAMFPSVTQGVTPGVRLVTPVTPGVTRGNHEGTEKTQVNQEVNGEAQVAKLVDARDLKTD